MKAHIGLRYKLSVFEKTAKIYEAAFLTFLLLGRSTYFILLMSSITWHIFAGSNLKRICRFQWKSVFSSAIIQSWNRRLTFSEFSPKGWLRIWRHLRDEKPSTFLRGNRKSICRSDSVWRTTSRMRLPTAQRGLSFAHPGNQIVKNSFWH